MIFWLQQMRTHIAENDGASLNKIMAQSVKSREEWFARRQDVRADDFPSQPAPSMAESLGRIAHQTERLQKLIVDLRWLTELDEGSIEQTAVDLADVLEAQAAGIAAALVGAVLVYFVPNRGPKAPA